MLGDASKASKKLNWEPTTSLEEMIAEMINHDLEEARKESILRNKGFMIHSSNE